MSINDLGLLPSTLYSNYTEIRIQRITRSTYSRVRAHPSSRARARCAVRPHDRPLHDIADARRDPRRELARRRCHRGRRAIASPQRLYLPPREADHEHPRQPMPRHTVRHPAAEPPAAVPPPAVPSAAVDEAIAAAPVCYAAWATSCDSVGGDAGIEHHHHDSRTSKSPADTALRLPCHAQERHGSGQALLGTCSSGAPAPSSR